MEKETKCCPYCGEEILAVAKKCKHCGEWLNEGSKSVEIEKANNSTVRTESTTSTSQPISNKQNINKAPQAVRTPLGKSAGSSSENKIYHSGCFWFILVLVFAIIIAVWATSRGSNDSSSESDSSCAADSIVPVMETPMEATDGYEAPYGETYYYNDEAPAQHTEEQGKDIPGDDASSYDYNRSDYYGN